MALAILSLYLNYFSTPAIGIQIDTGAIESAGRRHPSSALPETPPPPPDGGESTLEIESLKDRVEQSLVAVRPETREFYENLDYFFKLQHLLEDVAKEDMPRNAVAQYDDIELPDNFLHESVPQKPLQQQLDDLYIRAEEVKPKFDIFCRELVHQAGLDPDAPILVQGQKEYFTYTAVPLKRRDRAVEKAQNDLGSDARRLFDVVRSSVVVDTETNFESVVKSLYDNYVEHERNGVRVVKFDNYCKHPLPPALRIAFFYICVKLDDGRPCFVCELQVVMKRIFEQLPVAHIPYEYFRTYFKGGDEKAVRERLELLEKFAGRHVEDISHIVTSALEAGKEDQLQALAELFHKLSELEIVTSIRRRLRELVIEGCDWNEHTEDHDWHRLGDTTNSLASAIYEQGKYDDAKPLFEDALRIAEKLKGDEHRIVASVLNNLAKVLESQGEYDEAKPLLERAIQIDERALGHDHPQLATNLNNLASVLESQGKYDDAKPLLERAIQIGENTLGPEHPDLAISLNNFAGLLSAQVSYLAVQLRLPSDTLMSQRKFLEALPVAQRAAAIFHKTLGPGHQHTQQAAAAAQVLVLMAR